MILDNPQPPQPPEHGHGVEIVKAVLIATLSAVTGGLVQWWIEDLKEKRRRRRERKPEINWL